MANEQNLVPFKQGYDERRKINPAKGVEHSKTRLLKLLSLVIKSKNQLLNSEEETEMSVLEKMDMGQIALAMNGDTKAYKEIMDRLEGRSIETVKQSVEISTEKRITVAKDGNEISLKINKAPEIYND